MQFLQFYQLRSFEFGLEGTFILVMRVMNLFRSTLWLISEIEFWVWGLLFVETTSIRSFDIFVESAMPKLMWQHSSFACTQFQTNLEHPILVFSIPKVQLMQPLLVHHELCSVFADKVSTFVENSQVGLRVCGLGSHIHGEWSR